jgi:hypothetical protein
VDKPAHRKPCYYAGWVAPVPGITPFLALDTVTVSVNKIPDIPGIMDDFNYHIYV